MYASVVALLATSFGFGIVGRQSASASPADWRVPRLAVMPLGDSITEGARSTTNSGYRGELWNRLAPHAASLDFVGSQQHGRQLADRDHEGHSGWRIDELSVNIEKWLAAAHPNVVLLHIGANDMDQNYHADTAPDRLGGLIDHITRGAPGVTVLVSSLVPSTNTETRARIDRFNTAVPRVVEERRKKGLSVGYVSMAAVTVGDLGDWLHPNDGGYVKMADAFYSGITRAAADGWIHERVDAEPAPPRKPPLGDYQVDINGDGRADYLVVDKYGAVNAWLNNGDNSHVGWSKAGRNGRIATGVGVSGDKVRFADINGDRRADYLVVDDSGSVHAWLNDSPTGQDKWTKAGVIATGAGASADQIRLADINGDGKADHLTVDDIGVIRAWLNNGDDGRDEWTGMGPVSSAVAPGIRVRV